MMNAISNETVNLRFFFVHGKNSGEQKTFVAYSAPTGYIAKFCCNCKGENIYSKSKNGSYSSPPPGIGFTFAACHLSLSQQADGFQLLVDSDSS